MSDSPSDYFTLDLFSSKSQNPDPNHGATLKVRVSAVSIKKPGSKVYREQIDEICLFANFTF